jgi:hypothetical protein
MTDDPDLAAIRALFREAETDPDLAADLDQLMAKSAMFRVIVFHASAGCEPASDPATHKPGTGVSCQ